MVAISSNYPKSSSEERSVFIQQMDSNAIKNKELIKTTKKDVLKILCYCFFSLFIASLVIKIFMSLKNTKSVNDYAKVLIYDGKSSFRIWKAPPPHDELAEVSRYVVHIAEWGSLSTNSTHQDIEGYPFVNVFSISDGPFENSTGVPYFYFTPLELSVKDLKQNNKASLTVSLAQSDYCSRKKMDPQDPRCAHVILTGSIVKIEEGSEEERFARNALFSRHYEMPSWPTEHAWFFAKLDIVHIYVLDFFGGAGVVSVEDYFNAKFI